jgi:site-specific DNA-methyltransferase (adenine-specific)
MQSAIAIGRHAIYQGCCIDVMASFRDHSVDMVFADLPYGTTYAKWDSNVPAHKLWVQYRRIVKPGGAIVLTASQPFTSMLVASAPDLFRCEWIWDKVHGANFANANKQPLKSHESVLVFATQQTVYNPQKVSGPRNHVQGKNGRNSKNVSETRLISKRADDDLSGMKYPKSIVTFAKHSSQCGHHPTQKPVDMISYFIRTYSNPDAVVLDNTMGSGSTLVAAHREGRVGIGIEISPGYVAVAVDRLTAEVTNKDLFSTEK